jgi:uncharacterized protein YggL (DUF469 family)
MRRSVTMKFGANASQDSFPALDNFFVDELINANDFTHESSEMLAAFTGLQESILITRSSTTIFNSVKLRR